tara:strand:- start:38092 stop:38202 length:111 start_codon:yes stop_codon:yes gene_type:complete
MSPTEEDEKPIGTWVNGHWFVSADWTGIEVPKGGYK